MSLTSSNKIETNKYELTVEVDAQAFEEALEKAYRKEGKKITIPGFRKGKAPRKMIEKLYGEGVFFEDAVNASYGAALQEAIDEAKLTLVDRPEVEVLEVSKEKGYTFKATCITKPEVEVTDYKGIKVEKNIKEVTDADVDAEVKRVQERNGRIISVDDRPAQMSDNTIIDFEGYLDGEKFDGGSAEKFSLTLGSGQFIPGFEEQIVGHSVGDEFDVNVTFPEDYHAEELKGKAVVFKVKLHEIQTRELPELDDEFAKDVSEFDTLAEYKEDVRKKLTEQNEKAADTDVENKLIDAVIDNMKAEIPQVMFENRITESVREFEYRLQSQGLNLETYLQYTGMEMDAFRKTFEEQAQKQVKIRLALEKIVELENIVPTEEEVNEEYTRLAEHYSMDVDKVKSLIPAADLSLDLAVNKAIDLIKDSADVTEVKGEGEEPKKKPAAKKTAAKKTTAKKAEDGEENAEEAPKKKTTRKKAEKTESAE